MTFQYCFDGSIKKVNNLSVSSPRTWGCFRRPGVECGHGVVFPTHVGVFPFPCRPWRRFMCLPHARGGVSNSGFNILNVQLSSPRTWGCFLFMRCDLISHLVFPTHVGVFPSSGTASTVSPGLPHARGGVSAAYRLATRLQRSSPRTWGCFWQYAVFPSCPVVFPTHVGVFLRTF